MKFPSRLIVLTTLFCASLLHADDLAPPVITATSVSPAAVDVSSGDATVQVTLQITDDESGFQFANLYLYNAYGNFVTNIFFTSSSVQPGGDDLDGTYVVDVTIPQYASDGIWKVEGAFLDNDNRLVQYGGPNTPFPLSPTPGTIEVDVTNEDTEDTMEPQLASVSISPSVVDVTSQDQTVTVTLNITDDMSGFRNGSAYLYTPSQNDSGFQQFIPASSGVGTPQDATYTFQMTIPRASVGGEWTLPVSFRDRVGNSDFIFDAPGSTLTVINQGNVATGDLSDACDATQYDWTTGGETDWFFQTDVTYDGIDAARSGAIGDDGSSEMELTVTGPGTLTFWWKVDSEDSADVLSVYTPGSGDSDQISGNVDWTEVTLNIDPGEQTVLWTYSKNSSIGENEDAGWVDRVYFSADSDSEQTVLQYIDITPDPVVVSSGQADYTVTFEVSDDYNGVYGGRVTIYDSNGTEYDGEDFYPGDRISGDEYFGTYQKIFTVYQSDLLPESGYSAGTWRVGVQTVENATYDTSIYNVGYDDFPNPGDELFTVSEVGVPGAIGIESVNSITPDPVDVTSATQTVTVDFDLVNPNGDFSYGYVEVWDSLFNYIDSYYFDEFNGDGTTFSVDIPIPQFGRPGIWSLKFDLYDQENNETYVDSGFPNPGEEEFEVINTDQVDIEAPTLTSISISPGTIDTSSTAGVINVTVAIADAQSGVNYAYVEFYDPSDTYVDSLDEFVGSNEIIAGSFTVSVNLPQGSLEGVWRCEVGSKDNNGNFRRYGTGAFEVAFPVPGDAEFTVGPVTLSAFAGFAGTYSLNGIDAKPGANPDFDWANNALELVLGLDPTVTDLPDPSIYQFMRVGDELRLDFKIASGLNVVTAGEFLEITDGGGGAPLRLTGQIGESLAGPWTNVVPVAVGGGIYRVSRSMSPDPAGFSRLQFVDP